MPKIECVLVMRKLCLNEKFLLARREQEFHSTVY